MDKRKKTLASQLEKEDILKLIKNNNLPQTKYKLQAKKDGKSKYRSNFNPEPIINKGRLGRYIHFSKNKEKLFCLSCCLGAKGSYLAENKWLHQGFDDWQHFSEKHKGVQKHMDSQYHRDGVIKTENMIKIVDNKPGLPEALDKARMQLLERNKSLSKAVFETVKVLGAQGMPFRGHREHLNDNSVNKGNFLTLMDLLAKYDPKLEEALNQIKSVQANPDTRNQCTLTSNNTQNQIIDIVSGDIVKQIGTETLFLGCKYAT